MTQFTPGDYAMYEGHEVMIICVITPKNGIDICRIEWGDHEGWKIAHVGSTALLPVTDMTLKPRDLTPLINALVKANEKELALENTINRAVDEIGDSKVVPETIKADLEKIRNQYTLALQEFHQVAKAVLR